ncbi:MAG: 50S ribosomal protein L29 [Deltaproteobacteria bacterium]|nr:50S ribosomal protein L29 [Deltaproteobacteria bacterium]
MKPSELREKTPTERAKLASQLKEELFLLRIKKATGQLEKVHRLREIRRDLARLITLERETVK